MHESARAAEGDLHSALVAMQTLLDDAVTRHRAGVGRADQPLMTTNDSAVARSVLTREVAQVQYGISVILPAYQRPADVVLEGLELASERWAEHIKVRVLAPMPAISRERLLGYAHGKPWLTVRQNDLRLPSVVVVDRRAAMARSALPDGRWHAALVCDPAVVDAVRAMFMSGWRTGIPLAEEFAAETLVCRTAAQIIAHLVEGHTDEMAARDMDISVRTYRRNVADIMRSLRATSRFQAGVVAAELGLARRHSVAAQMLESAEA